MYLYFLGPRGSYSHIAANAFVTRYFPDTAFDFVDNLSIQEMLCLQNHDSYCIIPLENSLSGEVYDTYRNIFRQNYQIVDLITLPITHQLYGLPNAKLSDIKTVYSHPQALLQTKDFTEKYQLHAIPYFSTSDALTKILDDQDLTQAAIASRHAEHFFTGIKLLAADINNHQTNYTRFLVVTPLETPQKKQFFISKIKKTEQFFIIFTLPTDKSGLLEKTLAVFSKYHINLTNIKSQSIEGKIFEYFFIIEGYVSQKNSSLFYKNLSADLFEQTDFCSIHFY